MTKSEVIKLIHSKLKSVQKDMFLSFLNSTGRKYIIHSSRRLGKTYLLCVLAICTAINKDNAQIRYASTTQKAVRKMIIPIFKEIILSLPTKYKPKWNGQEGAYVFPNGSMIHVCGVNNGNSDSLRGTAADLAIVDEAAFVDQLTYLIESVLMPQLISTGGKLIMASSSPLSPAHDFATYIAEAQSVGQYSSYTIYDSGYSRDIIAEFCKESGGENSTCWKREYLNALIVDDEMSIIPEWKDEYVQEVIPDELRNYYHQYESMDLGIRDKTVWLSAYYDFKNARLVIEDEFEISGIDTTTRAIADLIKTHRIHTPYRAISDNNNLLLLLDLSSEFSLHFSPTNKDTLAVMINAVRLLVSDGRITVNPNCKQLIGCLKYGVYQDSKRHDFGRSKAFGHYDALAALIYLVRNLDQNTNPIPSTHGINPEYQHTPHQENPSHNALKNLFNLK
jgi:hypothetical protein